LPRLGWLVFYDDLRPLDALHEKPCAPKRKVLRCECLKRPPFSADRPPAVEKLHLDLGRAHRVALPFASVLVASNRRRGLKMRGEAATLLLR
jgi:hypothetical protein